MSEREDESRLGRREFVRQAGLGVYGLAGLRPNGEQEPPPRPDEVARLQGDPEWPSLRHYDAAHLDRIALPLGGIGTGTLSLGGRGDLRDFEMMNRPAKGFVPTSGAIAPFLALFARGAGEEAHCRLLEGPLPLPVFEGSHGSPAPNASLPRFRTARFATAYPFGRVLLSDPDLEVAAELKAFNPFVPGDAEASGLPLAVLEVEVRNTSGRALEASVCATLPNFVGMDGSVTKRDWKGDAVVTGTRSNVNLYRRGDAVQGVFLSSEGVSPQDAAFGTIALATLSTATATYRTSWAKDAWGDAILDFWDDFAADGRLEERPVTTNPVPLASLAVSLDVPAGESRTALFLVAWHFPNRYSWTAKSDPPTQDDWVGNHYATLYRDAWEVAERTAPRLPELRRRTVAFVQALSSSDLPAEVKEAALFNLSTLRTQTCFRTADGRFYGFEGSADRAGCCHGSCTHVWNYEQATPFLFADLARSMREVEFAHATADNGLMSFRVNLPLGRAQEFGRAAADGQTGCVLKMYRDWQLCGDDAFLRALWPKVKKAVEFAWIRGGWDADRDGVMEGCQHNTMDVEYYGPNPQMGLWYLGALRAAEEMARHVGDAEMAVECRRLFESGSTWIDAHLWNGEYYEQRVVPPRTAADVAPGLRVGMGATDATKPDYQLGAGCLVDQLVGQFVAHVCGLGPLVDQGHARTTLRSIFKYNLRPTLREHFNPLRAFAVADESALIMADYPKARPARPFPYYGEAMTGFEYVAAVGMLYEGLEEEGLRCIRGVRSRYDGQRRNPFDEAECGHHYARAMASWAAILALTGFRWSAVTGILELRARPGRYFWSNGSAWGTFRLEAEGQAVFRVRVLVAEGRLDLAELRLTGFGAQRPLPRRVVSAGEVLDVRVPRRAS